MARRVSLEIVGDSSSLEKAFANAANSARKFNQQVGTSTRVVNQTKAETSAIQKEIAATNELIKVRSRRAASLGPFRLAGVGLGAGLGLFAATQAVRELSQALETTGEAAFTTEGRLKNMVAALTTGNLVGAVKAIASVPKTLEELGVTADTFIPADRLAALKLIAKPTVDALRDFEVAGEDTFDTMKRAADLAGTANAEAAQEILDVVDAQNQAQAVTRGMEDAQRQFNRTLWDGTSALVAYKRAADDLAGPRGPGARAFEVPPRPRGMPTLPPLSPSQRRELDLIGAEGMERIPLLQDELRQLNNQMKDFHGNNRQELKIRIRIRNTEEQIAGIYAEQAEKRKQAAEEARRAAEAAAAEARRREVARELRILEGPIPTRANLIKQFEQLQKRAALDTGFPRKMTEQFARVARLLKEEITPETREAINSWFETVRGEFDKGAAADPLAGLMQVSTRKLTDILAAGTGANRAALAGNISGLQLRPIQIGVNIDGREIARATTQQQARSGKRTARQTSGAR